MMHASRGRNNTCCAWDINSDACVQHENALRQTCHQQYLLSDVELGWVIGMKQEAIILEFHNAAHSTIYLEWQMFDYIPLLERTAIQYINRSDWP